MSAAQGVRDIDVIQMSECCAWLLMVRCISACPFVVVKNRMGDVTKRWPSRPAHSAPSSIHAVFSKCLWYSTLSYIDVCSTGSWMNLGCCSAAQHGQATGRATVIDMYYAWLSCSLIEHGVFSNSVQRMPLRKDVASLLGTPVLLRQRLICTKKKRKFCCLQASHNFSEAVVWPALQSYVAFVIAFAITKCWRNKNSCQCNAWRYSTSGSNYLFQQKHMWTFCCALRRVIIPYSIVAVTS